LLKDSVKKKQTSIFLRSQFLPSWPFMFPWSCRCHYFIFSCIFSDCLY